MNAVTDLQLSMQSFLPLSRMAQVAEPMRIAYANATPFPHFVIDNFFDPTLIDQVLAEFPMPGQIKWQSFDNDQEITLASAAEASPPIVLRNIQKIR
jgi:hypothetical protein